MKMRYTFALFSVGLFGCGSAGGSAQRSGDSVHSDEPRSSDSLPVENSQTRVLSDSQPSAAGSNSTHPSNSGTFNNPLGQAKPAGTTGKFPALSAAAAAFELPARSFETPNQTLWATYYRTPRFEHLPSGFDLLDMNGRALGPRLSQRQWCDAAMEGSVQVFADGQWKTYNYAGSTGGVQVDCSPYFKHPVGRTRFKVARGPYGDGVQNYILSPFRTIAVDPAVIPYGTVIYIDVARGLPFTTPDGIRRIHDGYFFAADTGGLIRDNHIDVFIGTAASSPFSWITSDSTSRIDYQTVPDADLRDVLLDLHL